MRETPEGISYESLLETMSVSNNTNVIGQFAEYYLSPL